MYDIWNTNPNVVTSFFSTSSDDLMVLICTILSKVLQNVTCLTNKISTGIKLLEAGRAQPDRRGTALQYNRLVRIASVRGGRCVARTSSMA